MTMDPLETLSNEHGLIRQFIDNLTMAADHIEHGRRPSTAFFEKAVDFARGFADGYHHFKEEHVLFVRMAQKKQGEVDAQLDALRNQHERSRELVSGIGSCIEGYAAQDPRSTTELLEHMGAYASLLRHHIHTEDHLFFPMARGTLTAADLEEVSAEFARERERHGGDAFERNHKAVVDMGSILTHLREPAR
jgi:hemerythrin-like domain-containing protein